MDSGFPNVSHEFRQFVDPSRLRGAMITHSHEDHAGNVALLAERGVPVSLPALSRGVTERPAPLALYRRWTWGSPDPTAFPLTTFTSDEFELLPAPGHSRDHHVVWDKAEGTLFGGDLFIGVKVRVAHPGEDIRGTVASLRRVAELGPARFFDAHRGLVARPMDSLQAKVQWIEDTIGAIEDRHRAGANESQILRDVLGGEALLGLASGGDYSRRNFVRSIVSSLVDPRPSVGA
ncbi:MAG: MBL fold metallo-hydrolase [Cytophagaceae bacterium]|nr:MBL fold metallo-hydrolase [Gemmatimonadaceae bacterium]